MEQVIFSSDLGFIGHGCLQQGGGCGGKHCVRCHIYLIPEEVELQEAIRP